MSTWFRKIFSCESALFEIISELNNAKDKRLINLLIIFKKGFETADSKLLLHNLFHYGLNNLSLIISNYFQGREQIV